MLYSLVPLWQGYHTRLHPLYTVESRYDKPATHVTTRDILWNPIMTCCYACTLTSMLHGRIPLWQVWHTRDLLWNAIMASLLHTLTPVLYYRIPLWQVCHTRQHSCCTIESHYDKSVKHVNTRNVESHYDKSITHGNTGAILWNPIMTSLSHTVTPVPYCGIPLWQVSHAR